MKKKTCRHDIGLAAIVLALGASDARAQGPQPPPTADKEVNIMILKGGGADGASFDLPLPPGDMGMDFLASPIDVSGQTVTDAPYSAEAVTEVVQTLADGNRILHNSKATLYRDSAGRTRREQGLAIVGSLVGGGAENQLVQIADPEAGVSYVLDVPRRQAFKTPIPRIRITQGPATGPAPTDDTVQIQPPMPPLPLPLPTGAQGQVFFRKRIVQDSPAPLVENLGTQTMEGVVAEGTRSTITIPAGAIGNEQPISTVTERWYSPQLKALVLSRQSDPRYGDTIYRLSNIVRLEPAADLFRVPPDFTIVEPPAAGNMIYRMEKKK